VVVWRRQLAQVAVPRLNDAVVATAAETACISVRLTEQAKARQASHKGSPGHCSSNLRTMPASCVARL